MSVAIVVGKKEGMNRMKWVTLLVTFVCMFLCPITAAGEREPFHVHPWKSLLVVLKPGVYEIEYDDGRCEQWNGQIGVYELPANERYSTNIGEAADEMIRFEVKE